LAYPIQKKTTGFYHLIEFKAEPEFIGNLETQYKRDERIIRFHTISMDKHAIAYAERRRNKISEATDPKVDPKTDTKADVAEAETTVKE
jgi:small subunit ribosomal protein S6